MRQVSFLFPNKSRFLRFDIKTGNWNLKDTFTNKQKDGNFDFKIKAKKKKILTVKEKKHK